MTSASHWTERSPQDFLYSIASDFIEDLKERMRSLGMSQSKLAKEAKVNKSYVSRMFKDPGNLTLETIVKFARTVGMKVSIVPYEDPGDPHNKRGPIGSDIFRWCWEHADRPADIWGVRESTQTQTVTIKSFAYYHEPKGRHGMPDTAHKGSLTSAYAENLNLKYVTSGSDATTTEVKHGRSFPNPL